MEQNKQLLLASSQKSSFTQGAGYGGDVGGRIAPTGTPAFARHKKIV
jgi:hypothetical protein